MNKDEQQVFDWYKDRYSTDIRLERSLENVLKLARMGSSNYIRNEGETDPKTAAEEIIAHESLQQVENFLQKVFKNQ